MNEVNLIMEGFKFMVLGMGMVYIFLFLLVQVINWQKIIVDYFIKPQAVPAVVPNSIATNNEDEIVVAIMSAVQMHCERK